MRCATLGSGVYPLEDCNTKPKHLRGWNVRAECSTINTIWSLACGGGIHSRACGEGIQYLACGEGDVPRLRLRVKRGYQFALVVVQDES